MKIVLCSSRRIPHPGLGSYEPADRPLLRDFRRGGVSAGLAFGGLLHRPTWSAAHSFTLCCIFNLPFGVYALLAWFQPSSLWLVGGGIVVEYFGYGFGFVGLTLFMMQQVAPGASPDGALRFRFGYHEPLGDAHGHGFRLFERSDELPDLLPRGDARHHSGFCDHPAGSLYL